MTHHKSAFLAAFKNWLPLAVVIIIFGGLIYAAVQLDFRSSANDPQVQIAEDLSTAISSGSAPVDSIVPPNPTADLAQSLSPFVILYSATGTPIGGSVALDGKLPNMPGGVLDYVKLHGQDRLTWQPKPGVRAAVIVTKFSGPQPGYILAGRLLREIEKRELNLELLSAIAVVAALLLTFLVYYYLAFSEHAKHTAHAHAGEGEGGVAA